MHATGKMLGKNCLKTIRDTFFLNMWSVLRRRTGELDSLVGAISNRRGKLKPLGMQGDPPIPSLGGTTCSPHLLLLVFSFKANDLQQVQSKIKKR